MARDINTFTHQRTHLLNILHQMPLPWLFLNILLLRIHPPSIMHHKPKGTHQLESFHNNPIPCTNISERLH